MDSAQIVGLAIGLGSFALLLLVIFVRTNIVICHPNEVCVISGRQRRLPDGSFVGYRILRGGRGLKLPLVEQVRRLSLANIPIEIEIHKALAKGLIPITVDARAQVKIGGSDAAGLPNAIERFLGRSLGDVARVAKETIEGSLRGVVASVTPEDANARRLELAGQVGDIARTDLANLGIVLDFFKIQNISDDHEYLNAIGRKKSAEVRRDAEIAEATAQAEARIVAADQKRRGRLAEVEAEKKIVQVEQDYSTYRSNLEGESNKAEERAKLAREIARAEEQKEIEARRIAVNQSKYEADVVVPAEAERRALELAAQGKAARILEDGKATAEAIRLMQDQWDQGKTRDLFLIQMLPELLDKVTRVVSENLQVEKLTILDWGNGNGLPSYVKNITNSSVVLLEQLKNATGIDVPGILSQKKDGGNVPKELG